MKPLINILIRTSNRPTLFARCLQSIEQQTYRNYRIIVGYDHSSGLSYIPDDLTKVYVYADQGLPYFYDCYCNDLKVLVDHGWFFFLDDDDMLTRPTILEELAKHLNEPGAVICQMLRNGMAKPRDVYIKRGIVEKGKIGLPCLVLHSDYRHTGELDGHKAGDYRYIKTVIGQVTTKYICLPLVDAGSRGHGQMEHKTGNFHKFQK